MPGGTPPPPPVPGGHNHMRAGSMNDLDRKNAIEVMELSDMHHPSCKLSQRYVTPQKKEVFAKVFVPPKRFKICYIFIIRKPA